MPTQSFDGVLRDELRTIAESRRARGLPASAEADTPTKTARNMDLIGLAFSGGGIRSATFNLGILQGLANRNLIPHIDYLSTVSGGGYIGSWLVAWMKRCNPAPDAPARQKLEYVQSSLKSKESAEPHDPEPIRYLRRYSNYLTPKASMFSADTWTVAAIWTRNTLLNLAIIVCAFAAILVLPRAAGLGLRGVMSTGGEHWSFPPPWPEAWIAGLTLVIAVLTIGRNLWLVGDGKKGYAGHRGVQWLIVGPLVVAAAAMSEWIYRVPGLFGVEWMLWPTVAFGAQYLIIAFLARFVDGFSKQHELELPFGKVGEGLLGVLLALGSATLSGFITAALLHGVALLFRAIDQDWAPWAVITIGVPLILAVFAVGMVVQVGLMGRDLPDASREWLGRLRAWTMIYGLAWLALMAASIYGPYLVYAAGAWTAAGIGGLWGATSLGGLFASNSGKTGGQKEQSGPDLKKTLLEALALVAPYVFMAGFVVMIALGVHELVSPHKGPPKQTALAHTTTINGVPEKVTLTVGEPQRSAATVFDDRKFKYPADLKDAPLGYWGPGSFDLHNLFMLFAVALVAGAILSWRVDINEFSMHHFYKNRLVRGYLGASCGAARDPDPFIGFDNGDDLALSSLAEKDENRRQQFATGTYCGPYPILNGALNLAGGTALAWRERKAASYIFTPLYCGYDKPVVDMESNGAVLPLLPGGDLSGNGYRSTDLSSYTGGIRIGTAMAISGAAASPNMGYHTSTAIAFLLTVFNVRLGWWLGNPARGDKYSRSGPTIGLPYLAVELFGLANTDKGYINISDGGHFENLGIYELVRRHCRYIIACDGEQDGNMTFGGLGNAIRKCRTDFGVEIEIDVEQLRLKNGFSGAHCVVGKIKYPFD